MSEINSNPHAGEIVVDEPSAGYNTDRDPRASGDVTPLAAAGGTKGEIVGSGQPKDGPIRRFATNVQKAFEIIRGTGRTSMLVLSSNWAVVRIPVGPGDPYDLTKYATLESLQQFRTLHRNASHRLTEARQRLAAAEEYARSVDELSIQDGWADDVALLRSETPPPGGPEYPNMIRCRALRPFHVQYQRPFSTEYARWWLVRNGFELEVAALDVTADGSGAILDVPAPMVESLKAEGLIALAKPQTPLQLSNGRLLGGN